MISKTLQEHFNTAFPDFVCLMGSVLPNGFAQITPRGGIMVFDDQHLASWERGKGSSASGLADGTKLTVYSRKPPLRADGTLPKGGIARFYGTARICRSALSMRRSGAAWCGRKRTATPRKRVTRS